jgi:hypothetical protein
MYKGDASNLRPYTTEQKNRSGRRQPMRDDESRWLTGRTRNDRNWVN